MTFHDKKDKKKKEDVGVSRIKGTVERVSIDFGKWPSYFFVSLTLAVRSRLISLIVTLDKMDSG